MWLLSHFCQHSYKIGLDRDQEGPPQSGKMRRSLLGRGGTGIPGTRTAHAKAQKCPPAKPVGELGIGGRLRGAGVL